MAIEPEICITKYKNTRFYAVWVNGELLAVVCYKKGALAIKQALLNSLNINTLKTSFVEPVTVGTLISQRPPHRSPYEVFPHGAPRLYSLSQSAMIS